MVVTSMRTLSDKNGSSKRTAAFTLAEVVVSLALMGTFFSGILTAYVQFANMAEWSGYSLAAQSIAAQQIELVRASIWDLQANPPVDYTVNVPTTNVVAMDLPVRGTNITYVTNFLTLSTVALSGSSPTYVKLVTVKAVWNFRGRLLYTNTLTTYYSPDQ